MSATATATDTARNFVLVDGDGREVHRFTQKGSANRRAKTIRGARVVTAAEWDAEQAAVSTAVEELEAAEAMDAADQAAAATVEPVSDEDAIAELLSMVPARPVRDAEQLADADEMTGTDYPEVAAEIKREERKASRRDDYAARTETGPMLEVNDGDSDDEWSETRSYFTWRVAARRGRVLATNPTKPVATRVVDQDGAILWTSAADEGVRWALENGKHLKSFTASNANTAEKAAACFS